MANAFTASDSNKDDFLNFEEYKAFLASFQEVTKAKHNGNYLNYTEAHLKEMFDRGFEGTQRYVPTATEE